ncbi:ribonuclease p/mrp subunit [Anopheles darlingi]|uniref:Ribonuclease p/mrp subunit n=1 Tax=Anopheles darlingi TaxID=43151 RepID=W5JBV0_ANODA|nr:ribonuclease p/mrp subunit [Anopheles darlingi]
MSSGGGLEIIPTMEQLPALWPQDGEPFCDMLSGQEQQERRLTTLTLSSTSNISAETYEQFDVGGESKCPLPLMAKSTELTVVVDTPNNRARVALGVLIRLMLPLTHGVARGWKGLRGLSVLAMLRKVRESHGLLTTLFAFAANTVSMSLSSVQVAHRIDPLLRVIKLRKDSATTAIKASPLALQGVSSNQELAVIRVPRHLPEKCVDLVVLAEPPPGVPIRADIVLIHGLHGSLVNTWKQGLWNSEGRLVNFERPPKPPLRPPKRQRHSRSNLFAPPHVSKRPKFDAPDGMCARDQQSSPDTDYDESRSSSYEFAHKRYTYECGEPEEVHFADDLEYSFPTFRLRIEEDNRSGASVPGSAAIDGSSASSSSSIGGKRKLPKPKKDANWSPCWPGDWLPLDCPGVRVIALNYTTDPYLWRPVWITKRNRSSLVDRAREMSDLLIAKGVGRGHPIVWVGHSKGGIFIKQILVDAWESGRPAAEPLWRMSRGTFFYSVPHRGSPLADFNLPLLRQSVELLEIQKNCPSILELHSRFVALYHSGQLKIDVFSFVETALTLMSVLYLRIVGIDSADPGIGEVCGVHLDHREICKPRSRNCILYTELVKMINRVS